MKRNSKIIIASIVSFILFLLIFNSYFNFYFREIVVTGLKLKPKGTQEPGTTPYLNSQIYLFNPITQIFKPISPDNMDAYKPVWSPNGELLSFQYIWEGTDAKEGIGIINKDYQIEYFDLPPDISNINSNLAWSSNSEDIFFSIRSQDCHKLHKLNIKRNSISEVENLPNICGGNIPYFTISLKDEMIVELDGEIFALESGAQKLYFITNGHSPIWHPSQNVLVYDCASPENGICDTTPDGKNKGIIIKSSYPVYLSPWSLSWAIGENYIGFVNGSGAEGDLRYITVVDMRFRQAHNIYQITGRGWRDIDIIDVAWRP